jgi:hypothetical protein
LKENMVTRECWRHARPGRGLARRARRSRRGNAWRLGSGWRLLEDKQTAAATGSEARQSACLTLDPPRCSGISRPHL